MSKQDQTDTTYNAELEQVILGTLLIHEAAWARVSSLLEAQHFADPVHQEIFEVIADRSHKGHLVSPVVLKDLFRDHEGLAALGGPVYLVKMAGVSTSVGQIRAYVAQLVERRIAREALKGLKEAQASLRSGVEPSEAVARLQGLLMALPETAGRESSISMIAATTQALKETNEAYHGRAGLLKTGLDTLDRIIRGLAPGDLMLLGGATSMGKTAVAVEVARRVAERGGVVGFASLEMEPQQLVARIVSSQSRVPYELARAADEMSEENFTAWVEAAQDAAKLPIHIFPRHVRDIAAIHATAQGLRMQHGRLDLVVVDYAQLCRAPGREFRERMLNVSIGLKTMAKMLNVPVLALVQLDRKIGDRPDPRPQTYDIKETSQFETDADQIVFCHRAYYYLERKGPALNRDGQVTDEARADWEADKKATAHNLELIVRKNRHGRLATAEIGCHMPTNRFWNLHDNTEDF